MVVYFLTLAGGGIAGFLGGFAAGQLAVWAGGRWAQRKRGSFWPWPRA